MSESGIIPAAILIGQTSAERIALAAAPHAKVMASMSQHLDQD